MNFNLIKTIVSLQLLLLVAGLGASAAPKYPEGSGVQLETQNVSMLANKVSSPMEESSKAENLEEMTTDRYSRYYYPSYYPYYSSYYYPYYSSYYYPYYSSYYYGRPYYGYPGYYTNQAWRKASPSDTYADAAPAEKLQQSQNDQQSAQYNQQPVQYNQQPAQYSQQSAQYSQQPGQPNQQPGQPNQQPGQPNQQPGQYSQQPGQSNQQPGQYSQQPGQSNQQPGQYNQQPGQSNQQPGQPNQQPGQPNQQQEKPGEGFKRYTRAQIEESGSVPYSESNTSISERANQNQGYNMYNQNYNNRRYYSYSSNNAPSYYQPRRGGQYESAALEAERTAPAGKGHPGEHPPKKPEHPPRKPEHPQKKPEHPQKDHHQEKDHHQQRAHHPLPVVLSAKLGDMYIKKGAADNLGSYLPESSGSLEKLATSSSDTRNHQWSNENTMKDLSSVCKRENLEALAACQGSTCAGNVLREASQKLDASKTQDLTREEKKNLLSNVISIFSDMSDPSFAGDADGISAASPVFERRLRENFGNDINRYLEYLTKKYGDETPTSSCGINENGEVTQCAEMWARESLEKICKRYSEQLSGTPKVREARRDKKRRKLVAAVSITRPGQQPQEEVYEHHEHYHYHDYPHHPYYYDDYDHYPRSYYDDYDYSLYNSGYRMAQYFNSVMA